MVCVHLYMIIQSFVYTNTNTFSAGNVSVYNTGTGLETGSEYLQQQKKKKKRVPIGCRFNVSLHTSARSIYYFIIVCEYRVLYTDAL